MKLLDCVPRIFAKNRRRLFGISQQGREYIIARKVVKLFRMIADIKLPCVVARLITVVIYIPANDAKAITYCYSPPPPPFSLSISVSPARARALFNKAR